MLVAYAVPAYVGLAILLCSIYSCIECTNNKGKFDNSVKSILLLWSCVVIIVTSVLTGAVGEMMAGMTNMTHLLIALCLVCVSLSVSSSMIYWS